MKITPTRLMVLGVSGIGFFTYSLCWLWLWWVQWGLQFLFLLPFLPTGVISELVDTLSFSLQNHSPHLHWLLQPNQGLFALGLLTLGIVIAAVLIQL